MPFSAGQFRCGPGQPVAIYRTNDRECFHWFLAIIRAGGIAVPLNPLLSVAEVRRILAESGTEILVTDKAVFDRNIVRRDALNVKTWIQADDEPETLEGFIRATNTGSTFPPVSVDPSATVAVFHTSGTSGFPKGAALSSNALLGARASTVLAGLFLGPRDVALIALPWSHIMAVSIVLYGLMAGIRGCFLDHFDVDSALDLVERFGITAFVGVPAMFARLVNSDPDPARLKSVRVWLSASDHLPSEVRLRLRQFGALFRLPGRQTHTACVAEWLRHGGTWRPGHDGCRLVAVARKRRSLLSRAPFSHSCRRRKRPAGARWRDRRVPDSPSRSCSALLEGHGDSQGLISSDGWLRTGDLATRNRLGLIRLVGRMKDVIKSGGYSVYVRELEEAMLAHPGVARAVGFGLPHKEKGEIPVAAVELQPGCGGQRTRVAGLVPAESGGLQSAAPHLDSRVGRLAAE